MELSAADRHELVGLRRRRRFAAGASWAGVHGLVVAFKSEDDHGRIDAKKRAYFDLPNRLLHLYLCPPSVGVARNIGRPASPGRPLSVLHEFVKLRRPLGEPFQTFRKYHSTRCGVTSQARWPRGLDAGDHDRVRSPRTWGRTRQSEPELWTDSVPELRSAATSIVREVVDSESDAARGIGVRGAIDVPWAYR